MQDLIQQERFELEVLDKLNSKRLLGDLVFGGGTMLRLCFGLNRFSVDLDFWVIKDIDIKKLFKDIRDCLAESYTIKDAINKFHTLVFEVRSKDYPRNLKIEIRKEKRTIEYEQAITYSKFSSTQVLLNIISLSEMMKSKIEAFIDRKEIRDIFDMEFLFKKGIIPEADAEKLKKVIKTIDSLTKTDYTVKLGSLLESEERKYYTEENFKIIKMAIKEKLGK